MPFYRLNEDDLRPDDDFDPEDVPRAIAAVGFDMFTKGTEMPIHEHRKAQLELRLQLGIGKPEAAALVFCNHDGSPISPNYFSIMWSRAVARAGLPKRTFHSLRHSHASALIRAGLDVVRVSRQLGHSSPTITLGTYAHEFEEADSGAADAIGKVLR